MRRVSDPKVDHQGNRCYVLPVGRGQLPGKVKKRDILKVVHGDATNRTSYLPFDTSDFSVI